MDDDVRALIARVEERIDGLRAYVDSRLASVETVARVTQEHANKAESYAESWRQHANEWRAAMTDRERTFLTRRELYIMISTLITAVGLFIGFSR